MTQKNNHKTTITHEEINELPLGAFEGKVVVLSEEKNVTRIFAEINKHTVVGFDTETKPVFVRGHQNKVSLMQIALPDTVFLVRLNHTGMQPAIIHFLENENILKAGVALRDDIKGLQRLKHYTPAGFVELAEMSKKAGLEVESVKKLTALLLGFRISKSAQTSNWEAETFNEKQISYAATDAWVCLEIYKNLSARLV
ncbi:MAG TPA: 3'-5' exonuclease [Cyclobacteriaceae bacterium]|nr:3'-5' exonuclease [Cyclobacteriaceae bacterium]